MTLSTAEIFSRALRWHGKGEALWMPAPYTDVAGKSLETIDLADVGYIEHRAGRFHKLFNATDPPRQFEKYSKYLVDDHDCDTSNEEKFLSQSVQMHDLTVNVTTESVVKITAGCECIRTTGAALVLPGPFEPRIERIRLKYRDQYTSFVARNCRRWLEYARLRSADDLSLKDVVFVTTIHKTYKWSSLCFTNATRRGEINLGLPGAPVSGSVKWSGMQGSIHGIPANWGPTKPEQPPSPRDQCIFIDVCKCDSQFDRMLRRLLRFPRTQRQTDKVKALIAELESAQNLDSGHIRDGVNEGNQQDGIEVHSLPMGISVDKGGPEHSRGNGTAEHGNTRRRRRKRRRARTQSDPRSHSNPGYRRDDDGAGGGGSGGGRFISNQSTSTTRDVAQEGSRNNTTNSRTTGGQTSDCPPGVASESCNAYEPEMDGHGVAEFEENECRSLTSYVASYNPLDVVLDYILEARPEAQLAVVDGEDLAPFLNYLSDYESFPSVVQQINPEITSTPNGWVTLTRKHSDEFSNEACKINSDVECPVTSITECGIQPGELQEPIKDVCIKSGVACPTRNVPGWYRCRCKGHAQQGALKEVDDKMEEENAKEGIFIDGIELVEPERSTIFHPIPSAVPVLAGFCTRPDPGTSVSPATSTDSLSTDSQSLADIGDSLSRNSLLTPSSSLTLLAESRSLVASIGSTDEIWLNKLGKPISSPISTDPTPKDVLDHLDVGAKLAIQVADVMESATTSLEPIRTLYNTDHPQLKPFKKDINCAVGDYIEAVESSTETAQQGVTYATNIHYLLGTLSNQQLSDSDRKRFMEETKEIGAKALEDAKRTCEAFGHVLGSFYGIVENMKERVTRKEAKQKAFGQAVKALRDFAGKVQKVLESSQKFAVWWTDTKGKVGICHGSVITAGNQPLGSVRITFLKEQWEDVGERYQEYNRDIALLKPQFPRPPKVPSLWSRLRLPKKQVCSK